MSVRLGVIFGIPESESLGDCGLLKLFASNREIPISGPRANTYLIRARLLVGRSDFYLVLRPISRTLIILDPPLSGAPDPEASTPSRSVALAIHGPGTSPSVSFIFRSPLSEANDSFVGLIKEKYIQPNPISKLLMITNRCAQGEILLARMYFARQIR